MDELVLQLQSADSSTRQQAAFDLGETGSGAAVPHLIQALNDTDLLVQIRAVQALRNIGDSTATQPLCQLLAMPDLHRLLVSNTCRALGALGDSEALPTLIALLQSEDGFTRYDAAFALGEIGDKTAIPPLRSIQDDNTMPEYEDEDGGYQDTLYSVGEQAVRAISSIESNAG